MKKLIPIKDRRPVPPKDTLVFGKIFTDHMLITEYKDRTAVNQVDSLGMLSDSVLGWTDPVIQPYQGLTLAPSCSVLHYGLEVPGTSHRPLKA